MVEMAVSFHLTQEAMKKFNSPASVSADENSGLTLSLYFNEDTGDGMLMRIELEPSVENLSYVMRAISEIEIVEACVCFWIDPDLMGVYHVDGLMNGWMKIVSAEISEDEGESVPPDQVEAVREKGLQLIQQIHLEMGKPSTKEGAEKILSDIKKLVGDVPLAKPRSVTVH